jgi:hypothetical protein
MMFNARDLDQVALKERAEAEAQLIYNKPSTRRDRSLEEITETVLYGHVAEQYLIENGYADDPRPYKDVIGLDGEPVEVKVTEGDYYVEYVLDRANKAASEAWRKYPKWLYIFIGDRATLDYHLEGIYLWNGENFCLHSREAVV